LNIPLKQPLSLSELWTEIKFYGCPIDFETFSNLYLRDLSPFCSSVHKLYQQNLNAQSFSSSQVAYLLYQFGIGFSGGKADRKITPANFLPFELEVSRNNSLTPQMRKTCDTLLKEQKLSPKLTGMVASLIR
jgi:hypothetical protein